MSEASITVRIGKVDLRVPVYQDEAATRALAEELSGRLAEIEQASDRIDTPAFMLTLAYECAVDARQARAELARDTKDMLKAMDALRERVQRLAASLEAPPPDPDV
ncbi:MAG: cell division protein ZapA [Candidatus Hydrogenedentota bacterium]